MNKRIGRGFIYLFLLLSLIGCTNKENQKENSINKQKTNTVENYPFYHKEKEKRYQAYQKENQQLSWKDVIIRVNIGLDQPYYTNVSESKYLNTNKVLVNKYFYLKEEYIPENLVLLDTTYSKGGIYLVEEASLAFKKLVENARKEGITIRAISAYRSYSYQLNLYNRYVSQEGKEQADTYSARPGFSEHQTGLCVDIDDRKKNFTDFENTQSFNWMQQNAANYGFILRFPKDKETITGYSYEAWHYRYVGVEHAKKMKQKNLTFDEYYMEFLEN